jgi:predicted AlkP superfamily pyrophosphatase or phosphodiesterase
MSIAQTIEKRIRGESEARCRELNLPAEFIFPNYGGRSIVNVPASMVDLLGGEIRTSGLDPEILQDLATNVNRVVFVIVDAAGYQRFLDALDSNPQNGFQPLVRAGAHLVPLTSTFPSTTTAALTSLCSGYTPAEHGLVGYQLFLREYGLRADMIGFSPVATLRLGHEQLIQAGLDPENFSDAPSLPQTLEKMGVPFYNFIEQPYIKSALARVQLRGATNMHGFVTSSDMWLAMRESIEAHRAERAVFTAYWSAVDAIAHTFGPSSEKVVAELNNLAYSFEREFLRRLSPAAREGTLFLLTADHGQIDSSPDHAVYMRDHPDLRDRMVMDYAGEPRAAYLYCRNGETDAAREYLKARLGSKFAVIDSKAALATGLFGTGRISPEVRYRIGDLIVWPRQDYYLWDRVDKPEMRGRHGGLGEKEMLVPLLAARLDGT